VIQLIENLEFGKAFRILRQHKLDINLLHDVNPIQFLLHIDKFVAEVKQVDYLNLFINSLVPEQRGKELEFMRPQPKQDLMKLQHVEYMTAFKSGAQVTHYEKVNSVCDTLREALEAAGEDLGDGSKYLLPVLTTYIKKQP
jgi:elongator complex protein 1